MSQWSPEHGSLDFTTIRQLYRSRRYSPHDLIAFVFARIRATAHPNVFITLQDEAAVQTKLKAVQQLARDQGSAALPLLGIPFVVKDNIDVAGVPTTAACRGFAYTPEKSAAVVERLEAAGAVFIGKTNLDQFATGLTGVVSSYGATRNVFDSKYISGGSSSGSAVAVASGLVAFGVGTDTAGSGRVPAAFNNLVGLKPTRGLISNRGVVPACRSLDCVAIFTNNIDDAAEILNVTKGFDSADPFSRREANGLDLSVLKLPVSRFRFGVPCAEQLQFYGDVAAENLYRRGLERMESIGGKCVEVDASSFLEVGKLLYEGPWVTERLAAIEQFHAQHAEAIDPLVYKIMARANQYSSVAVFKALYRLQELRRESESQWAQMDIFALPTTGTIFKLEDAQADPGGVSAKLGLYTNFVNLLDLSAIALPLGFRPDGLPLGMSLIAPAFNEPNVIAIAQRFARNRYGGLLAATIEAELPSHAAEESDATGFAEHARTQICVVGGAPCGSAAELSIDGAGGDAGSPLQDGGELSVVRVAGDDAAEAGAGACGIVRGRGGD